MCYTILLALTHRYCAAQSSLGSRGRERGERVVIYYNLSFCFFSRPYIISTIINNTPGVIITRRVYIITGAVWNRFDEYTTTRAGHNLRSKISWTRTRGRLAIHPALRVDFSRNFSPPSAYRRTTTVRAPVSLLPYIFTVRYLARREIRRRSLACVCKRRGIARARWRTERPRERVAERRRDRKKQRRARKTDTECCCAAASARFPFAFLFANYEITRRERRFECRASFVVVPLVNTSFASIFSRVSFVVLISADNSLSYIYIYIFFDSL